MSMWQHLVRIKCTLQWDFFFEHGMKRNKNKQWLAFKITYLGELTSRSQSLYLSHSISLHANWKYSVDNFIFVCVCIETGNKSDIIYFQQKFLQRRLSLSASFLHSSNFFVIFRYTPWYKTIILWYDSIRLNDYEKKNAPKQWKMATKKNSIHNEEKSIASKCRNVISMLFV